MLSWSARLLSDAWLLPAREAVFDPQSHGRGMFNSFGLLGTTKATSLHSQLAGSSPPVNRAVEQIENCWRTSPSSYAMTCPGFV